jgi:hypothetical protein
MEEKEIVEAIDQARQGLFSPMWEHPESTTATTMEMATVETENISKRTMLPISQSPDVAVLVACPSGSGKPDLVNLHEGKKYFWRTVIPPGLVSASGRQPYIYEVLEEYIGFPGEAVGSVFSWPELWRQSELRPTDLRGVFPADYPRKVLFTKPITFKTSELPRWKPKSIIGLRTFEEEDA